MKTDDQDKATFKTEMPMEIELPSVPNFLKSNDGTRIPIERLTDEALTGLGTAWTTKLRRVANTRRSSSDVKNISVETRAKATKIGQNKAAHTNS